MDVILVDDLAVSLRGREVLRGVRFKVPRGGFYSILGPNGSGKTTLLKTIAGIYRPSRGMVEVRGSVGLVPQNNLLLPWLSLRENIALPLRLQGLSGDEVERRVEEAAKPLMLTRFLDLYPKEASGGTLRKVAIARALATGSNILLLDEPFNGLDIASSTSLANTLAKLKGRVTIVMVSHQLYHVAMLSDTVALLHGSPARIVSEARLEGLSLEDRLQAVRKSIESLALE